MKGISLSQAIQAIVSQNRHHSVQPGEYTHSPDSICSRKGKKMAIITVGIDPAKSIFAVHGINVKMPAQGSRGYREDEKESIARIVLR